MRKPSFSDLLSKSRNDVGLITSRLISAYNIFVNFDRFNHNGLECHVLSGENDCGEQRVKFHTTGRITDCVGYTQRIWPRTSENTLEGDLKQKMYQWVGFSYEIGVDQEKGSLQVTAPSVEFAKANGFNYLSEFVEAVHEIILLDEFGFLVVEGSDGFLNQPIGNNFKPLTMCYEKPLFGYTSNPSEVS